MTFDRYAEWLTRGRVHQEKGRMIDALLCYRRALREGSPGIEARFHLGEIAWHMGNPAEAMDAWRGVCALSPTHAASSLALADALAATGEFNASRAALSRVSARDPHEPRASALCVLLDVALGESPGTTLADAIRSRPVWPLPLLARVAERVLPRAVDPTPLLSALIDAVSAATVTRENEDGLRRVARALAEAGESGPAQWIADRYAEACCAFDRPAMPLVWPRRTAGDALRIGVLAAPDARTEADETCDALDAGARDRWNCATIAVDAMPRAVAALDLDVLIDIAGVRAASGPLLASHPARALWLVARPDAPSARALGDRIFLPDEAAIHDHQLAAALRDLHASAAGPSQSALTAEELAARWEASVRAHERSDFRSARDGYARILEDQPGHAPALYLLGALARSEGNLAVARDHFRAAIEAAPGYDDARVALIGSLVDAGDPDEAAAIARAGLAQGRQSAGLLRALGQANLRQGDAAGAATAFESALQRDATDGETHYNHGVALQTSRRFTDAARAYQRALAFRPELHAADFNLGVIFDQQGNRDAAVAAFSKVLQRAPDHVPAYKALGETLRAGSRIDAWYASFERFEQSCPNHIALAVYALEVSAYRADFARIDRYLDGLRRGDFTADSPTDTLDALQQLLYLLHFFDVEPDLIARHARMHDALARTVYGEPLARRSERRPGLLRIGYLSGDFRNHVMGKMMWEAISRHDRARFDVRGYSAVDDRDEWTSRFESAFSSFATLGALSDHDAARRIAGDDLDILVDLSTHTKGARPGILALKPARVQITHVASAGTLAMSAIDFKLTDHHADVVDDHASPIEALLPMSGCVYPYRHVAPAATCPFTREALRIPREAVVIGAFVTPLKLSQRCLGLWREVLARIPGAVLAFSPVHPALRGVFERIATAAGIDSRRVVFVPQGRNDAENQARYRVVDFVLDPMPYGSANGTLEALDMQVPVVTLVGRRHAERTSYSILVNLGVDDTVTHTPAEYVAVAERLAADQAFMRRVRERIASGLVSSALTDMNAHTRNLEEAYRQAVRLRAPASASFAPA